MPAGCCPWFATAQRRWGRRSGLLASRSGSPRSTTHWRPTTPDNHRENATYTSTRVPSRRGSRKPMAPRRAKKTAARQNGTQPAAAAAGTSAALRVESCCLAGYSAPLATDDSRARGNQRRRAPPSRPALERRARLSQTRRERRDHPRSGDELSCPNPASAVRSPPGADPRPPASARTGASPPALVQSPRARPTTRSPASTSDPNAASADPCPASAA